MTLKQYLTIMILGSILCWIAWGFVIMNIDPEYASTTGFLFFYVSLFLCLLGTSSLFFFLVHRIYARKKLIPMHRSVQKSFLEGLILALILIGLLYLQSQDYLHLWNVGILSAVAVFLILFKLTNKRKPIEPKQE